ncbi:MAG TPA: hypothetical protein VI894_02960 [Candidatus Nanoarchaeia archaeon]|nr:hypothetical protein [Candidatus Nanoarchaeia archaeon]
MSVKKSIRTKKQIKKTNVVSQKKKIKESRQESKLYICEKCGALSKSPGIHEYDKGRFVPKIPETLKLKLYIMWGYKGVFGLALLIFGYYNLKSSLWQGYALMVLGVIMCGFLAKDIYRRRVLF